MSGSRGTPGNQPETAGFSWFGFQLNRVCRLDFRVVTRSPTNWNRIVRVFFEGIPRAVALNHAEKVDRTVQ